MPYDYVIRKCTAYDQKLTLYSLLQTILYNISSNAPVTPRVHVPVDRVGGLGTKHDNCILR